MNPSHNLSVPKSSEIIRSTTWFLIPSWQYMEKPSATTLTWRWLEHFLGLEGMLAWPRKMDLMSFTGPVIGQILLMQLFLWLRNFQLIHLYLNSKLKSNIDGISCKESPKKEHQYSCYECMFKNQPFTNAHMSIVIPQHRRDSVDDHLLPKSLKCQP